MVAEYNLTLGQFAVLEALYHKGDLTVGQVQRAILSSSGTVPVIVGNLEKRGYLARQTDEADRRRRTGGRKDRRVLRIGKDESGGQAL